MQYYLLLALCLLGYSNSYAQSKAQQAKAETCEKVYREIAQAINDPRPLPAFNFIYQKGRKPYYNAYYNPQNNTINFGEGIYDLALEFGADSLNALAMVLGHELAHYYKDHGWGMSFGTANEDSEIADKIYEMELDETQRARMEAEADYFGGLFGYLAGYNTLEVGGQFYSRLYETIGLPDSTKGYPSRKDRIAICDNSQKMLQDLLPLFQMANYLALMEQEERAARAYAQLAQQFPGRAIYNNAAVNFLLAALKEYKAEDLPFQLPLQLELQSRLQQNSKGNRQPKKERFLAQARQMLDKSLQVSPNYAPALLNEIIWALLKEDRDLALFKAKRLAKNKEMPAHIQDKAHLLIGIILAQNGEEKAAKKQFKQLRKSLPGLAEANLSALKSKRWKARQAAKHQEISGEAESYDELPLAELPSYFENNQPDIIQMMERQQEDSPELLLIASRLEQKEALLLASYGQANEEEIWGFLQFNADYQGETARGIKIGSRQSEIEKLYGFAANSLSTGKGKLLYYPLAGLIFSLDQNGQLDRWLQFSKLQ